MCFARFLFVTRPRRGSENISGRCSTPEWWQLSELATGVGIRGNLDRVLTWGVVTARPRARKVTQKIPETTESQMRTKKTKNVFCFSGMYFHVCIFCMCFIERIGFYKHLWTAKFLPFCPTAFQSCEPFRFFVCLYVWMGLGLQNTQFLRWSASSVYPPTRETKNGLET